MKLSRCEIESGFLASIDEVWALIGKVGAPVGWLGFQSGNMLVNGSLPARDSAELGTLIDGELSEDERSTHIRYQGDGWIVTTYTPGAGEQFLADDVLFLTADGTLSYERLWAADPQSGMHQVHARLVAKQERR
jgi:hypothetical protein